MSKYIVALLFVPFFSQLAQAAGPTPVESKLDISIRTSELQIYYDLLQKFDVARSEGDSNKYKEVVKSLETEVDRIGALVRPKLKDLGVANDAKFTFHPEDRRLNFYFIKELSEKGAPMEVLALKIGFDVDGAENVSEVWTHHARATLSLTELQNLYESIDKGFKEIKTTSTPEELKKITQKAESAGEPILKSIREQLSDFSVKAESKVLFTLKRTPSISYTFKNPTDSKFPAAQFILVFKVKDGKVSSFEFSAIASKDYSK